MQLANLAIFAACKLSYSIACKLSYSAACNISYNEDGKLSYSAAGKLSYSAAGKLSYSAAGKCSQSVVNLRCAIFAIVIFVRTFLLYTYIINLENVNISKQYEKLKKVREGFSLNRIRGRELQLRQNKTLSRRKNL